MMTTKTMKIVNVAMTVIFVVSVAVLLVVTGFILNNWGYKDGYCSALGGSTIGNARVCDVDGRVVEIPTP